MVRGETEDGHDLGGGRDHESVFARHAVQASAEPDHHVAERAVVHVDGTTPRDLTRVQTERVAVVHVVVQHGGQKRVRRGDRVQVAREMEVDVRHRDDLRVPATGRASLDAEHGPQARLAYARNRAASLPSESVRQSDRHRRLAFARARRCHPRHQHEPSAARLPFEDRLGTHLGFVAAVELQFVVSQTQPLADRGDGLESGFRCDLDVGAHVAASICSCSDSGCGRPCSRRHGK